ncbi:MAG: type II toxin-antitoxin system prevent-host-death family antitoxin [Desulfobacterales bacterium]|nr:type II toxin-antitoxin system prevent-host-death family antitoxin [Desulfobacterales bacterium]
MEPLDVFTVRDLRQRTGELLREAEKGHLSLVTKHGRPAFVTVPFDRRLLSFGINQAMALHLFEQGLTTLSQSAKIACVSFADFVDLLNEAGIPAVDYPPEDLDTEIQVISG